MRHTRRPSRAFKEILKSCPLPGIRSDKMASYDKELIKIAARDDLTRKQRLEMVDELDRKYRQRV